MGFETEKSTFSIIFYIIVQHVKNIFPKFFEVGRQDFSKTNASFWLKFCTILLEEIDS